MVSIRWAPVLSLPAGFKEVWQVSETRTLLPMQAVIAFPENGKLPVFLHSLWRHSLLGICSKQIMMDMSKD